MRPVPVSVPVSLLHSLDRNYLLLWCHMHISILQVFEVAFGAASADEVEQGDGGPVDQVDERLP